MFRTFASMLGRIALGLVVTGSPALADPPMPPPKPKQAPPVSSPSRPPRPSANPPQVAHPPLAPAKPLMFHPAPVTVQQVSTLRVVNEAQVAPAPPGASPPPPAQPAQARFRVTLRGFRCDNHTVDDTLENDGAGDEVIVRCWTRVLDGETVVTNRATGVDGIFAADDHHGDAFQRFVRAGTANRDHGGIVRGNRIAALPGVPADAGAAGRFPLTVFEGNLVAGRTVAVIVPTLWEWDDFCGDAPRLLLRGDPFPTEFWTTNRSHENDRLSAFESAMSSLARTERTSRLARTFATAADGRAVRSGHDLLLPTVRGDMGGNRGIGSIDTGDGIVFQPRAMVLNYTLADQIVRAGGVVPVRYLENTNGLGGDYTVFLFVERLP
jgi:hypothetical protein